MLSKKKSRVDSGWWMGCVWSARWMMWCCMWWWRWWRRICRVVCRRVRLVSVHCTLASSYVHYIIRPRVCLLQQQAFVRLVYVCVLGFDLFDSLFWFLVFVGFRTAPLSFIGPRLLARCGPVSHVKSHNLCSGSSFASKGNHAKKESDNQGSVQAVSYTHLTLPTNREV